MTFSPICPVQKNAESEYRSVLSGVEIDESSGIAETRVFDVPRGTLNLSPFHGIDTIRKDERSARDPVPVPQKNAVTELNLIE